MHIKPALGSEKTVLGALLLDSDLFKIVENILTPQDFLDINHQIILYAMCELFGEHGAFDAAMVADKLHYTNPEYIYSLAVECPSTKNIEAHCMIIREKSVQRHLVACTQQAIKEQEAAKQEEDSCGHCDLANFFVELGHEIANTDITEEYLRETIVEVNRAMVHTLLCIEDEGEDE